MMPKSIPLGRPTDLISHTWISHELFKLDMFKIRFTFNRLLLIAPSLLWLVKIGVANKLLEGTFQCSQMLFTEMPLFMVSALTKALCHSVSPPTPGCVYILCPLNILKSLKASTCHLMDTSYSMLRFIRNLWKVLNLEKMYEDGTEALHIPHTFSPIINISHEYATFVTINKLILIIII